MPYRWEDEYSEGPNAYSPLAGSETMGPVMTPETRKLLYGGLAGEPAPGQPSAPTLPSPGAPTPSLLDQAFEGFKKISPFVAKAGGIIGGGKDTTVGQLGLLAGQGLESMQLNAALRKMLSEYLSGKSGPTGSPSQAPGIDDLSAMGLTPEGVKSVYAAGMEATEKARKEPFQILGMAADTHERITRGDYNTAQIPLIQAHTQQLIETIRNMPYKNFMELNKAYAEIAKLQNDMIKLNSDLETAKTTREKNVAETEATKKKTVREEYAASPQGQYEKLQREIAEKRAGMPLQWHNAGKEWIGSDPSTGREVGRFPISAAPGSAGAVGQTSNQRLAAEYTVSEFMPRIEAGIMRRYPNDKQEQARQVQFLREMFKNPATAGLAPVYLSSFLTPEEMEQFKTRVAQHAASLPAGGPAIGAPGTAPPAAGAPEGGGFSVNPNAKVPPRSEAPVTPPGTPPPAKKSVLDAGVVSDYFKANGIKREADAIDYLMKTFNLDRASAKTWLHQQGLVGAKKNG